MIATVKQSAPGATLSALLEEAGFALDLRCGGAGVCGRCRVALVEGDWLVEGAACAAPRASVLACRTVLAGARGVVDVPEASLAPKAGGRIITDWQCAALPATDECVIAIDLGTTTVAAVKIRAGRAVAGASRYNSQGKLGDNVITRIHLAAGGKLEELRALALSDITQLVAELGVEGVARIAVSGNTVMTCILHGIDPGSIGVMPFTPPARMFPERTDWFGGVPALTVPAVSGYVGGDMTSGLVMTDLQPGEMLVDIGTNCEIVFNSLRGMVCAAAAAGPAFEGAGLSCGSRAVDGAVDHCFPGGGVSVIGGAAPSGVCGSGFVDFLAVKRREGALNEFGRYEPAAASAPIAGGISVTEGDIEQILKAKAAVWAGVTTLESHCGEQASKIYLAGGFARHLDLENAAAIGMLPRRSYEVAGNTSLAGAAALACDPALMARMAAMIDRPVEIALNTLPDFQDNYIDGLMLP